MANQAEVDKLIALLAKTETVAEDVAAVQQILDANPGIAREKGVSEDVEQ
jgi:phage tail protein X